MPRGKKKPAKKRADPPASQQGAAIAGQHATPATTTTEKDYIGASTRGGKDPLRTMIAAVEKGNAERLEQLVRKHSGKKKKRGGKKGKGKKGGGAQQINYNALVVELVGGGKATLLGEAAARGHLGVLELLLRIEGIKVNRGSEPDGATPLFAAAQHDHVACVARLLAEAGIEVNRATEGGITPLFMACQNGCVRSVKLLLAKEGIRVNQATHDDATSNYNDSNGQWCATMPFASVTPLRIAAQKGHLEVVRMLDEVMDMVDLDGDGDIDLLVSGRSLTIHNLDGTANLKELLRAPHKRSSVGSVYVKMAGKFHRVLLGSLRKVTNSMCA